MIIIKLNKKESIEKALKRYNYRVYKIKQLDQLRENEFFEKKSIKKRKQKKKAMYSQKKKDSLE